MTDAQNKRLHNQKCVRNYSTPYRHVNVFITRQTTTWRRRPCNEDAQSYFYTLRLSRHVRLSISYQQQFTGGADLHLSFGLGSRNIEFKVINKNTGKHTSRLNTHQEGDRDSIPTYSYNRRIETRLPFVVEFVVHRFLSKFRNDGLWVLSFNFLLLVARKCIKESKSRTRAKILVMGQQWRWR